MSFRQPQLEWESAPSSLVLLLTRSATLAACGEKESWRSSVTPSNTGVGLNSIGELSILMTGLQEASFVQLEKKLTSILVAFSFSFHAAHQSTTMFTAVCTSAVAFSLSLLDARIETSSANRQLIVLLGKISVGY